MIAVTLRSITGFVLRKHLPIPYVRSDEAKRFPAHDDPRPSHAEVLVGAEIQLTMLSFIT